MYKTGNREKNREFKEFLSGNRCVPLCATFNFKYVDTLLLIITPYTSLLDQKFCEKKLDLLFSFSTLTRVPENAPESSMHQWFLLLIQVLVISFPCSYRWGL